MMVRPFRARVWRVFTTWWALVESNPVVGSSSHKSEGFDKSWTPILVLLFSPPLQPLCALLPILVSAASFKLSSKMTSSTSCFLSFASTEDGSRSWAAYVRVSRTVNVGRRISCCITYALLMPDTSSLPLKRVLPEVASLFPTAKRPLMELSNDVFPLPLPPIMAVRLPLGMSAEMSSSIVLTWLVSGDAFFLEKARARAVGDSSTETVRCSNRTETGSTARNEMPWLSLRSVLVESPRSAVGGVAGAASSLGPGGAPADAEGRPSSFPCIGPGSIVSSDSIPGVWLNVHDDADAKDEARSAHGFLQSPLTCQDGDSLARYDVVQTRPPRLPADLHAGAWPDASPTGLILTFL